MARAIILVVGFCLALVSCTQRMVCPAYQSAYIYDKEALRKKFSYFKEDSTPKIYTASKNKYLIAEPVSYRKKVRGLQTVPMKRVNVVVPDSLKEGAEITKAELDSAANSIIDSTYIVEKPDSATLPQDSTYVISKDREVRVLKYKPNERKYYVDTIGFNTQQDNYMWYLRDVLLLPDAKLAQQGAEENKAGGGAGKKEKKGMKGFFKNLFKKKNKSKLEQDSTLHEKPVQEEDYGYDDFEGKAKDSTSVESQPQAQQQQAASKPKKGGMFSFMKKKDKPAKKKKEDTPPAKKEDDKDDGF